MKRIITCFICLVSCSAALLSSSPSDEPALRHVKEIGIPYFKNYSPKEHGGDVQNWAIAQDERGVMYFGNNSGVLEYDGVSWRLIPVKTGSVVRALALAADGRIYVGAQSTIGFLAPDAIGQLQYVSLLDSIPPEARDFVEIAKVYATKSGVYFQAFDRLFLWSNGRMRLWRPDHPFHISFVLNDVLYIRQPGVGLLQMAGDSLQLIRDGEKFSELRIYMMLPFGDNKILIGTREQGLFVYDGVKALPFPTEIDAFLLENQLYHGVMLANGEVALATLRGGVAIIDRSGRLQLLLDKDAGLQDNNVWLLASDAQQGLWLALNNGIARVETPSPLALFDERSGLRGSVESTLRHRGTLYVATHQGVFYLKPAVVSPRSPAISRAAFQPIRGIAEQCWALLSAGETLLAATHAGVYQIEGAQARLLRESAGHSYALYRSKKDTTLIYVGLENGLALLRFNPKTRQWSEAGEVNGVEVEVRDMAETANGILWLGTRSQGYLRVDLSDGLAHPPIQIFDRRHGLPEDYGWASLIALTGREVFATSKGLLRFDEKAQRFLPDTTFGAIYADSAHSTGEAAVDHNDNLWLQSGSGTAQQLGVAVRQPNGSYVWQYSPFARLSDFTIWDIYCEREETLMGVGNTWIGGPEGLVRYDAAAQKDYAVNFSALLRRVITVNGDSVLFGGTGINEDALTMASPLPYLNNSLRFEFSASSYDNESVNRFQYYLENFDKGWSAWTKETKKDYTNISEGRYRFHVRAKNAYDHVSAEAVYSFKILPPWYRNWWAYLIYLSLAGFGVYGLIKYRTQQLVQRSRALEEIVQQRTEKVRQQTEELETLDDIVKKINREVDLENVLRSLLDQGLKLFPQAEKASVLLYDANSGLFKFAAAAGYDLARMKDIAFTPAQLAQRYTTGSEQVGEGVYIVRNLQNLYEENTAPPAGPISVLVMTAVRQGQTEAYLIFDNLSSPDAFSQSDAHKLSRFRSHAVSAIIKAEILQELQEKNIEIIKTQEQLIMQEKLASLGSLTAGIAHEIKNPLNFVNNFAVLSVELAQELKEEIEQQESKIDSRAVTAITELLQTLQQNAQKINEHGKRADSIVRGMLQHSRAESGDRENTDLTALLRQAVSLAYHGMRAQENGFNVTLEEDYDATAGTIDVVPQDVSRVFLNLINNANYAVLQKKKKWDEMPKPAGGAGYVPTLSVRTKNLGDKVEIRIRDNGTGIPQSVKDKIFNPFFTTKPPGQGTGLGLSISYDIIQKHRGEMRVETEEGNFTEFIITLPKTASNKS